MFAFVLLRCRQTFDGEIIALGPICCEYNLFRFTYPDEVSYLGRALSRASLAGSPNHGEKTDYRKHQINKAA